MVKKSIRVGLLGLGTVGSAVYRLLDEEAENIGGDVRGRVEVARIAVRDLSRTRPVSPPPKMMTSRPEDILEDPSIDVVVEVMGGLEPAETLIKGALRRGKNVVTANKDLMAVHGHELLEIARASDLSLRYEAAVAAGVPIISCLNEGLASERIEEIMGIVNGTTNYILCRMTDADESLTGALARAQEQGYAEEDPTSDLSGNDAACKVAIMASLAFGVPVRRRDVKVQGITGITTEDVRCALEMGHVIKLVGRAWPEEAGIKALVAPHLVPWTHPLAQVKGVDNLVQIHGAAAGPISLAGAGAGGRATSSAIAADLGAIAHDLVSGHSTTRANRTPPRLAGGDRKEEAAFYLRVVADERPGVLSQMVSIMADHGVGLREVVRLPTGTRGGAWILLVAPIVEDRLWDAVWILEGLTAVRGRITVIRFLPGGSLHQTQSQSSHEPIATTRLGAVETCRLSGHMWSS